MKLNLGTIISLPDSKNKLVKIFKTNSIQVKFTKTNISLQELKDIKKFCSQFDYIFVHSSYQINIGSPMIFSSSDLYSSSLEILLKEIEISQKIGAQSIVVHMGKNVKSKSDYNYVYNSMVEFIVELFKHKFNIEILLETPAGQRGDMCWNLNDFVEFICNFSGTKFYSQIGICLDTCHIFQAGYDLNSSKGIKEIHEILLPIKKKIKLIHLNDSIKPVGTQIDLHAQIGQGHICTKNLVKFILPYYKVPMILETSEPFDPQIKLITDFI